MVTNKLLHALVNGLLIGLTYWILRQFDFFNNAGKGQQFGILLVVFFVETFLLNLVWPLPS